MAIGRLNPGATVNEAQLEMSVIARRLEQAYPATNKGVGTRVEPCGKRFAHGQDGFYIRCWALSDSCC